MIVTVIWSQTTNVAQCLRRGIELPCVKLNEPGPQDPERGQWIVRAGAHRLPQPIQRFLAISAKPQDAAEHADPERTVGIERDCLTGCRNRTLPVAAPHPH